VDGSKITGTLAVSYRKTDRYVKNLSLSNNKYIQDVNLENRLCIVGNYGDNAISIYSLTDEYTIGDLISTYTLQGTCTSLINAKFSPAKLENGKFNIWVCSRKSSYMDYTINIVQCSATRRII